MASPIVAVVMGSKSDMPTMNHGIEKLTELGIDHEVRVLSAHRKPRQLTEYVAALEERGVKVVIAAAGGAAHLPGVIAAQTQLPVLGVPMETSGLGGLDSLLSIVQMPRGVPVATFAIGVAGAVNAALFSAAILQDGRSEIADRLRVFRERQSADS
ncbi:MAG: 5-(carboxyamino)imidazole ribonucleotide mutase [Planctomycetota bacterium]|nr:5-(carboxyamino)imidazole ribonucleotide mutase [Planctomycetota bacterium]